MSNIKLTGHTWDTSGIYDAEQEKTQAEVNSGVKTAIGSGEIDQGTRNKGYYTGSVGNTIAFTSHNSSYNYVIDLTNYVGKIVNVKVFGGSATSTRVTALCDASDVIVSVAQEKDFVAGLYPNGWNCYPTNVAHKLYISYTSSGTSEVIYIEVGSMSDDINQLQKYSRPFEVYVDATAVSGGDGTQNSPFNTLQDGIKSGAKTIYAKAGEYDPISIRNRNYPLSIMLWDMPNSYSSETADVPKIKITGTGNYGIDAIGCEELYFSDIWCDGQNRHLFYIENVSKFEFVRCYASNNVTENFCGFSFRNSNGVLRGCKAWNIQLDGFNVHQYGNVSLYDCIAYSCGDDGVSHHDGTTGIVDGGEFYENGQGGVSSPTYGASVDINGAYSHDNTQYGFMIRSNADIGNVKCRISNSVAKNNTVKDIYIGYADVVGWNNIYDTKSVGEESTFTELANS